MEMTILSAGPLTSVQDRGRFGYMRYGITTSGVLDDKAYASGNALLGNQAGDACLEMTLKGATVEFHGRGAVAIVGADMMPRLNGDPVAMNRRIEIANGDVLELGFAQTGLRTYLCVEGGMDVPVVYGSRSTNLKCGFGGLNGRKLRDGDVLTTCSVTEYRRKGTPFAEEYHLPEGEDMTVRVILGPQEDMFTKKAVRDFLNDPYKVTPESDRMGIRLSGTALESVHGMDIISDAIPLGSIQVAADGQPIILLADRQTTGGYAKIATVISKDIWKLAQARPGTALHFEAVTVRQSRRV